MIRKTRLCALLLLAATCFAATVRAQQVERPAVEGPSSFAVITDSLTYVNCRQQIALYKQTVESEGLPVFVAYAQWQSPDEVRALLKRLHDEEALEGCVLIGDVQIGRASCRERVSSPV